MKDISGKLEKNKKDLQFIFLCVFAWGLVAHGYAFMRSAFSHDSLNEFNGADGSNYWKIQLGRFVVPLYRAVFRTDLTLPWLVGVLSMVWIGLAVFLIVRMFRMESKLLICLTAGILTANMTVTGAASTYMMDCDYDMFAMLCSVAAVYLWKNVRWGWLMGAIPVAVSLGIYQSYVTVTIALVMIVCILELLQDGVFRNVFGRGMKAIGMILLGGAGYYAALQAVLWITGIPISSGDYHSLDTMLTLTPKFIILLALYAYGDWFHRLTNPVSPYPEFLVQGINFLLLLAAAAILLYGIWKRREKWLEMLLCIALAAVLPLGMNLIFVLSAGVIHDLMVYSTWLTYLLILLLADWFSKQNVCRGREILRTSCMVLTAVMLYSNVQTANVVYLKKDLEQEAFLSLMTRVISRMEDYEGYIPGTTPVVFVGNSSQVNEFISGFEKYHGIVGADMGVTDTSDDDRIRRYFHYILGNPAIMARNDIWNAMQDDERTAAMPAYPSEGCIAMMEDVLVVKLG